MTKFFSLTFLLFSVSTFALEFSSLDQKFGIQVPTRIINGHFMIDPVQEFSKVTIDGKVYSFDNSKLFVKKEKFSFHLFGKSAENFISIRLKKQGKRSFDSVIVYKNFSTAKVKKFQGKVFEKQQDQDQNIAQR
jgi:hypothetical protein